MPEYRSRILCTDSGSRLSESGGIDDVRKDDSRRPPRADGFSQRRHTDRDGRHRELAGNGLEIENLREHQLGPQPLAERVLGHEELELGSNLARKASAEIRLEPVLQHLQPHLLEALGLARRASKPVRTAQARARARAPRAIAPLPARVPRSQAARPSAAICSKSARSSFSIQHERVAAGPTLDRARLEVVTQCET